MNWQDDANYRLKLAQGFYEEASQDLESQRYRSCVDNSQMCIENSAKAIIVCFTPVGKTHQPGQQLKKIMKRELSSEIRERIKRAIPLVEQHGFEEHILTDYGDEENRKTPWELLNREAAEAAHKDATIILGEAKQTICLVAKWKKVGENG